MNEKKKRIQESLFSKLDFTKEFSDEEIYDLIDAELFAFSKNEYISLEERQSIRTEIFYAMRKLDVLEELLADPSITEIMINGKDALFVEKEGRLTKWNRGFDSEEKLYDIIQQIVSNCNRVVNESSPIVDARLANGSRVNVVLKPIALNGPIVTIRRFPDKPLTMDRLISIGALTKELAEFLQKLVIGGYNIFVSGGTGSGKTTFLNALSNYIPSDTRMITIEDSAELQIQGIENLVRLETRNANADGAGKITIRDLIKSALRMRPDRIVVGEVRGDEAIDLLQAMNTGHDGSLSTGHANTAGDMIARLETMVLMGMEIPIPAIRQQIASAVDIIVHLGRLQDKSRKVLEVSEVIGMENGMVKLAPLYQYDYDLGKVVKKGELTHVGKLQAANLALD